LCVHVLTRITVQAFVVGFCGAESNAPCCIHRQYFCNHQQPLRVRDFTPSSLRGNVNAVMD
jgi:hypothetical protein